MGNWPTFWRVSGCYLVCEPRNWHSRPRNGLELACNGLFFPYYTRFLLHYRQFCPYYVLSFWPICLAIALILLGWAFFAAVRLCLNVSVPVLASPKGMI